MEIVRRAVAHTSSAIGSSRVENGVSTGILAGTSLHSDRLWLKD
jgi:hypothetical protein